MKSLSAPTLAHLNSETTYFQTFWRIQRRDGVVQGFCSNVFDITAPDPETAGTLLYKASTGTSTSNLETGTGKGVDNMQVIGVVNSIDIRDEDLMNGLYDDAEVKVFLLNALDTSQDQIILIQGNLGEVKLGRGQFEAEIRSLAQRAQQLVGKSYSATCRANLGDTECGVNLASYTLAGTVSHLIGRGSFKTTTAGIVAKPVFYYAYGKLEWTSGANTGKKVEVRTNDAANPMTIILSEIMAYPITVGDTFNIVAGCDGLYTTCRDKFSNILRFRGEPFIPGQDAVIRKRSV